MKTDWITDDDLAAAQSRFASMIPSFAMPAAYSVARIEPLGLKFAHVNKLNEVRPLPATVLAYVCGYTSSTGTFRLSHRQLENAIELLSPAEAATHMEHPNLMTWRDLLNSAKPKSEFLACFVADPLDEHVNAEDALFRSYIR